MKKGQMLEINKKCWDVVAPHFLGAEALPEYGPLTVTEDEIELFDEIKNRKVLDIGLYRIGISKFLFNILKDTTHYLKQIKYQTLS